MDPIDPVVALERLGGVADGTTLRLACGAWPVRKAVAEGRILHLGRNQYALLAAHEANVAAGKVHGVASHLSAAMAWGWKVKRAPHRPVVTVPRGRNLDDVHGWQTARVRTVVDCARELPFDEALAVADSALREGRVTRAELLAAAQAAPRRGRARRVLRVPRRAGRLPSRHPPLHRDGPRGEGRAPVLLGGRHALPRSRARRTHRRR
jgi:hypothetical protein